MSKKRKMAYKLIITNSCQFLKTKATIRTFTKKSQVKLKKNYIINLKNKVFNLSIFLKRKKKCAK